MPTDQTQPSGAADAVETAAKRRHPLRAFLAVVAIAVVLDIALCYLLEPYGGYSEVVWSEYYARADKPIETVLVGSSYAQFGFTPMVIEEELDSPTFSLATPAQSVASSYSAVERAISDHDVKRVLLGLGYDEFCYDPWINSAITFTQNKIRGESLADAATDVSRLFFDEHFFPRSYSIVAFFPWCIDHVYFNPGAIAGNVRNRLTIPTALEASRVAFPGVPFDNWGRAVDDGFLDFNRVGGPESLGFPDEFKSRETNAFTRICELCEQNGVELYVVVTPRPAFETIGCGSRYAQNMAQIRQTAESHGAHLLDYNMARPDYYQTGDRDFKDPDHLNYDASVRFSRLLCETISRVESGETVDGLFFGYDEWDDYLASIDRISLVSLGAVARYGSLELSATAYTGSEVDVEYQFVTVDPRSGDERVLQDYSSSPTFTLPVNGHGSTRVKVYARQSGSDRIERSREIEVLY